MPHWQLWNFQHFPRIIASSAELTSGNGVVTRVVSPHSVLDGFVCHEVKGMSRTYTTSSFCSFSAWFFQHTSTYYDARNAFPHRAKSFYFPNLQERLVHTRIKAAFCGLEDLKAGLRSMSARPRSAGQVNHTFSISTGYMTECSYSSISLLRPLKAGY